MEPLVYGSSVFSALYRNDKYLYHPRSIFAGRYRSFDALILALSSCGPGEAGGVGIVDIPSGEVIEVIRLEDHVGFVRPTEDPNLLLVGSGLSIAVLNLATGETTTLSSIPRILGVVLNDAGVYNFPKQKGSALFFGTKSMKGTESKIAGLKWCDCTGRTAHAISGMSSCSLNFVVEGADGLPSILSTDANKPVLRMYPARAGFQDSLFIDDKGTIVRDFSVHSGVAIEGGCLLANNRAALAVSLDPTTGERGKVVIIDMKGDILAEIMLECPRVTGVCPVAGEKGTRLAITTAAEGVNSRRFQNAGMVHMSEPIPPELCSPPLVEQKFRIRT